QSLERSLASLAQKRHDRDDKHEEENHQSDEGRPKVVERIEARTAVQERDLRCEANAAGLAGERREGLADGLHHGLRQSRLAALEMDLRRNHAGLLSAAGEIRGEKHIPGKVAGA